MTDLEIAGENEQLERKPAPPVEAWDVDIYTRAGRVHEFKNVTTDTLNSIKKAANSSICSMTLKIGNVRYFFREDSIEAISYYAHVNYVNYDSWWE